MNEELLLAGLDGGNPLGFLAFLGTMSVANSFAPRLSARWVAGETGWRPVIAGHGLDRVAFAAAVHQVLSELPEMPFAIDQKLPFANGTLRLAMQEAAGGPPPQRRTVDLLAGFGTDAYSDDSGAFIDTMFRLCRSGDASGQGLPAYVLAARRGLSAKEIESTLFEPWRYDDDCFSLRWDPVEDQRYALRANDPSSKANKKAGSRGVKAANALAAEALALLPVQPQEREPTTTGFARFGGRVVAFTWPIWDRPCSWDIVRSLLTAPDLSKVVPDRRSLAARGIVQVFRSERFSPNVYYKNFAPAQPV